MADTVRRVDYHYVTVPDTPGDPPRARDDESAGQFASGSMPAGPRPARSGTLTATATASPQQADGLVLAIFVDARGDYFATLSQAYSLPSCL